MGGGRRGGGGDGGSGGGGGAGARLWRCSPARRVNYTSFQRRHPPPTGGLCGFQPGSRCCVNMVSPLSV